jgi:hypothetical protein
MDGERVRCCTTIHKQSEKSACPCKWPVTHPGKLEPGQAWFALPVVPNAVLGVINDPLQDVFELQKLFFRKIRTFKHGFLHPDTHPLEVLDHFVSQPVIHNIITYNTKHAFPPIKRHFPGKSSLPGLSPPAPVKGFIPGNLTQ